MMVLKKGCCQRCKGVRKYKIGLLIEKAGCNFVEACRRANRITQRTVGLGPQMGSWPT